MKDQLVRAALTLAALCLAAAGTAQETSQAPPGLSWAQARSLEAKIQVLEKRGRARQRQAGTISISEGELNSYISLALAPQLPQGVQELRVRLDSERIEATGSVDLSLVREHVDAPGRLGALSLLGGPIPVLLRGRLQNQDGFGSLEWEQVTLASLPVPISVLQQIVTRATRTEANPQGFDIQAPFRLPYSLRRIRIEPGRALLEY